MQTRPLQPIQCLSLDDLIEAGREGVVEGYARVCPNCRGRRYLPTHTICPMCIGSGALFVPSKPRLTLTFAQRTVWKMLPWLAALAIVALGIYLATK